jgi:hypothetical protein
MKRLQLFAVVFSLLGIMVDPYRHTNGGQAPAIKWNHDVNIPIANQQDSSPNPLPQWKVKQMVWPPDAEIRDHSVVVDVKTKESCMQWLNKFLNKDWMPPDSRDHLVAMKRWGLFKEESSQQQRCDVFLVRFQKEQDIVQIQESPFNVVITFMDGRSIQQPRSDGKEYMIQVANRILHQSLRPNPESDAFHVIENIRKEGISTRIIWTLDAVISERRPDGVMSIDSKLEAKIGTAGVRAETNGTFVRFQITKSTNSARAFFDPYEKRFGE